MPFPNSVMSFAQGVALSVGDNTFDPGVSPFAGQITPATLSVAVRVLSIVTGPVVVRLEYSADNGATFGPGDPSQVMTALAAVGQAFKSFPLQFPRFRIVANLTVGTATVNIVGYPT